MGKNGALVDSGQNSNWGLSFSAIVRAAAKTPVRAIGLFALPYDRLFWKSCLALSATFIFILYLVQLGVISSNAAFSEGLGFNYRFIWGLAALLVAAPVMGLFLTYPIHDPGDNPLENFLGVTIFSGMILLVCLVIALIAGFADPRDPESSPGRIITGTGILGFYVFLAALLTFRIGQFVGRKTKLGQAVVGIVAILISCAVYTGFYYTAFSTNSVEQIDSDLLSEETTFFDRFLIKKELPAVKGKRAELLNARRQLAAEDRRRLGFAREIAFVNVSKQVRSMDVLAFFVDQAARTVIFDVLEVYELDVRNIPIVESRLSNPDLTHNADNFTMASFVLSFRIIVALLIFPILISALRSMFSMEERVEPEQDS